jgi:GTPase SAR1 family protein
MSDREILERVEVLLQCNEQLEFIQEVLRRSKISTSLQAEIQHQIDRIENRQKDPNLYLAVVGEFSSGKSTFINALLREELLKTSALVTTAAATKICHGENLQVRVSFSGYHPVIVNQHDSIDLPWLPDAPVMDIKGFIHTITAEPETAQDVLNLTIEHPSSFLASGITIIDTPGTNDLLEPITRKVVEEEADLAIIIIPATIPLSETLANFISNSLQPYLHRCIFVISRIDQIRPREQNKTLENLQKRLTSRLAIPSVTIYPCSAQVALDLMNGEAVESQDLEWQQGFTELESIIIKQLNRAKSICIAESLLRLLDRLFEQLDSYLNSQWQQYENRQREIKQEIIPNLSQFTTEQYASCESQLRKSIDTYISKTANCVDSHRESISNKLRTELFNATTEDALKTVVRTQTENLLQEDRKNIEIDLKPLTTRLAKEAIDVGKIFDRKFTDVYRRLQSIGGNVEAIANNSYGLQATPANVSISAQSLTQKFESDDGTKMGVGAVAGVVVGSILLPGLGTALGIAVGAWASSFFTPSLNERKQQLWEQLQPSLDAYFDTVKSQSQEAAKTYARSLETSLKQRIDSYIEKYQTIINNISIEQKNELNRLNNLQKLTRTDLNEIERRREKLSKQQTKLATFNN